MWLTSRERMWTFRIINLGKNIFFRSCDFFSEWILMCQWKYGYFSFLFLSQICVFVFFCGAQMYWNNQTIVNLQSTVILILFSHFFKIYYFIFICFKWQIGKFKFWSDIFIPIILFYWFTLYPLISFLCETTNIWMSGWITG